MWYCAVRVIFAAFVIQGQPSWNQKWRRIFSNYNFTSKIQLEKFAHNFKVVYTKVNCTLQTTVIFIVQYGATQYNQPGLCSKSWCIWAIHYYFTSKPFCRGGLQKCIFVSIPDLWHHLRTFRRSLRLHFICNLLSFTLFLHRLSYFHPSGMGSSPISNALHDCHWR